jgi:Uncharacterized proteins of PilT N-term./Vapc superfamily
VDVRTGAVIPDTSFLVQLAEPGGRLAMDKITEILGWPTPRFVVPSCVLAELRALSRNKPEAGLALEFARGLEVIDRDGPPDAAVLDAAEELAGIVATMDGVMLREARRRGIPTLTLHGGIPVLAGDP